MRDEEVINRLIDAASILERSTKDYDAQKMNHTIWDMAGFLRQTAERYKNENCELPDEFDNLLTIKCSCGENLFIHYPELCPCEDNFKYMCCRNRNCPHFEHKYEMPTIRLKRVLTHCDAPQTQNS